MLILFRNKKLEKLFNSDKELIKAYGPIQAKKIRARLDDLRDFDRLSNVPRIPPQCCHELSNNRAGQLSLDVDHPYRLIFVPAHDPRPVKEDGGLDWSQVTAVEVQGVEDTHE